MWSLDEIGEVCGDDAAEVDALLRRHRERELRGSAHAVSRQHPARRRPAPRSRPEAVQRGRAELFAGARAPGAPGPRRQGAARVERAVPRRARRGRGGARPRRLDGRRAHQRSVPVARAAPRRRPAAAGRGRTGAPVTSRTPRTTPRSLEALVTLAELDDVAWLAEARIDRRRPAAAVPRRAKRRLLHHRQRRRVARSCDRRTSRTTRRRRRTRSRPTGCCGSRRSPATRVRRGRRGDRGCCSPGGPAKHPTSFAYLLGALERLVHAAASRSRSSAIATTPPPRRCAGRCVDTVAARGGDA